MPSKDATEPVAEFANCQTAAALNGAASSTNLIAIPDVLLLARFLDEWQRGAEKCRVVVRGYVAKTNASKRARSASKRRRTLLDARVAASVAVRARLYETYALEAAL